MDWRKTLEKRNVKRLVKAEIEQVHGGTGEIPPGTSIYDYWPFNVFKPPITGLDGSE